MISVGSRRKSATAIRGLVLRAAPSPARVRLSGERVGCAGRAVTVFGRHEKAVCFNVYEPFS